ncbi:MAG TPA: hypothetical protein VLR49_05160 [Ferruginibacter sp.]|nr:hypothetical protein [Ferruginibacter sp.]
MNWTILILFGIAIIALIVSLVYRNIKDERDLESTLNNDYRKHKDEEGDIEIEDSMK